MKKSIFFISASLFLMSCGGAADDSNDNSESADSLVTEEIAINENFLTPEKWDSLVDEDKEYFIVSYAGVEEEQQAIDMVDSLKAEFENAGYLWIPDFASLSGKEMYAVFLDQSKYDFSVLTTLQNSKKDIPGIYVVRVNQSEERWEAYSPIDIRINGERQKMILTYATPEDNENYEGEDWGWFVNDVSEYFADNHPEVIFSSVYYNDLLDSEIQSIENELDLEGAGFGYVFMDGSKKEFTPHDMPDFVISSACEFFGYESPYE